MVYTFNYPRFQILDAFKQSAGVQKWLNKILSYYSTSFKDFVFQLRIISQKSKFEANHAQFWDWC